MCALFLRLPIEHQQRPEVALGRNNHKYTTGKYPARHARTDQNVARVLSGRARTRNGHGFSLNYKEHGAVIHRALQPRRIIIISFLSCILPHSTVSSFQPAVTLNTRYDQVYKRRHYGPQAHHRHKPPPRARLSPVWRNRPLALFFTFSLAIAQTSN